jgi:nitrate reductase beta subunit
MSLLWRKVRIRKVLDDIGIIRDLEVCSNCGVNGILICAAQEEDDLVEIYKIKYAVAFDPEGDYFAGGIAYAASEGAAKMVVEDLRSQGIKNVWVERIIALPLDPLFEVKRKRRKS